MPEKPKRFTVVIVSRVQDIEATGGWTTSRGDGVNPVQAFRPITAVKAAVWKRHATDEDLAKARRYVAGLTGESLNIVVLPTSERDPLGVAKRQTLDRANGGVAHGID